MFKDYFSVQSTDYARYRPDYPKQLYDFILANTPNRLRAWDCATGNGQVAMVLAGYFDKVIATDASKNQLDAAVQNPKITYKVAPAENSGLEENSIDLITVGQALHWFDFDKFYNEARRVAKPGALLAAFTYGNNWINKDIDEVIQYYYQTITGPYWPKERIYIDEEYRTIPFPFEKIPAPQMLMSKQWDLRTLMGYLYTWSATQQYLKINGTNPLELIEKDLIKAWGQIDTQHTVTWRITILAGRVN